MALKGHLSKVLRRKPTRVTRAVFWKIEHDSAEDEINMKIGRYALNGMFAVPEELECRDPKSELTLDQEEFLALIEFLRECYEPFRQGVKAFIPLDSPFDAEVAEQVKALFNVPKRRELVRFILDNQLISDDLRLALNNARRAKALREFEAMLDQDLVEARWQSWLASNSWILGSEFVRIVDTRDIDTEHISDFLMQAYDGLLDVVEIKRPDGGMKFWAAAQDRGNYVPSSDLVKAIAQASRYIYEVERESNSVKFLERVGGVRAVKPRCILVFGRSQDWNAEQTSAYRILNASYHNLTILTYDHLLERARRIVGTQAAAGEETEG